VWWLYGQSQAVLKVCSGFMVRVKQFKEAIEDEGSVLV
jgi:hypothetical protein